MKLLETPYHEVIERETVIARVLAAPRSAVFAAFAEQSALGEWFGPEGFTAKTHAFEFRVGGLWRFVYTGPDGTRYDNRIEYLEITEPSKLHFFHGSDKENDPSRFFVTITFDEQQNGKTVLTMRQLHPTTEQRAGVIGFGAVELGMQTLDKLAAYLAGGPARK